MGEKMGSNSLRTFQAVCPEKKWLLAVASPHLYYGYSIRLQKLLTSLHTNFKQVLCTVVKMVGAAIDAGT